MAEDRDGGKNMTDLHLWEPIYLHFPHISVSRCVSEHLAVSVNCRTDGAFPCWPMEWWWLRGGEWRKKDGAPTHRRIDGNFQKVMSRRLLMRPCTCGGCFLFSYSFSLSLSVRSALAPSPYSSWVHIGLMLISALIGFSHESLSSWYTCKKHSRCLAAVLMIQYYS